MATLLAGGDYAWARPDPAAYRAAGLAFAGRYYSADPSKNLTLTEAQHLAAAGVWVFTTFEIGARDALGAGGQTPYVTGQAHARLTLPQAAGCHQPAGRPVYFAVDFDAAGPELAAIRSYFDGIRSVFETAPNAPAAGCYGPVDALAASGCHWLWQSASAAFSQGRNGRLFPAAQIHQAASQVDIGGPIDRDVATVDDYGQWMPDRLPAPPTPAPRPLVNVTLRQLARGDHGADVATLQLLLNHKAHASLTVSGNFDEATDGAVQAWKIREHLLRPGQPNDGTVGQLTWRSLLTAPVTS